MGWATGGCVTNCAFPLQLSAVNHFKLLVCSLLFGWEVGSAHFYVVLFDTSPNPLSLLLSLSVQCVTDRLVKTGRKQPVGGAVRVATLVTPPRLWTFAKLVSDAFTAASLESHKDFPAKAQSLAENHHSREVACPTRQHSAAPFGPNIQVNAPSRSEEPQSICFFVFSIMHESFSLFFFILYLSAN